jgi:Predicted transcriptional regulators
MGWSQEELAKRAGVAPGTVSSVERGGKVRPGNLHAIRTTLGLPDGNEEPKPSDNVRAAKIEFAQDLIGKWLEAEPDGSLESDVEDLTRWIVARMGMRTGS